MKSKGAGRIKSSLTTLLIIITCIIPGACTSKKMFQYEQSRPSREYSRAFEKHTVMRGVYTGIETLFIVHATLFTPEFRKALLTEYYSVYYLDEGRKEDMRNFVEEESQGKARFVVALFTGDDRINDLEDDDTVWSLALVTGKEVRFKPASIKPVELNREEIARFFPYGEKYWFRYYDVRFDIAPEEMELSVLADPYLKLVLASPVGRAILVYTP